MHILLGIVGAVAAIFFFLYRVTYVAREGQELISDAKGAIRRHRWNRQTKHNPLDEIQDPRAIAILLMTETAKYKGALTAAQQDKIRSLAQQHFQMNQADVDDMMAHVTFATKDLTDVDNVLHKILRPLHDTLDHHEKGDLIAMMKGIAAVEGDANAEQRHLIGRTQDKLLS